MTDLISKIAARLERCEMELQAARGYIKALGYGVHALVARHADPGALADLWSHVLPEVADTHGGEGSALFNAALQQALATLSQQITSAADLHESDG